MAPRTVRVPVVAALATVALALTACSSGGDSGDEAAPGTGVEVAGETAGDDAGDGACQAFEAQGGTGATLGPVQLLDSPDAMRADVEGRLAAVEGIEPPDAVAAEWEAAVAYYQGLSDALGSGGDVSTLASLTTDALEIDFGALTDWYFESCR